ncbi:MAG: FkbM family methyltransferase [Xanthobacteraceae bacterium]|nr:FkbM family methyltransferase [Xanthobacteraceae bacterium]
MQLTQATKQVVKDVFPELWLRWHLSRRPKSAERELLYLNKLLPRGSVTIDVGANCGLYTRELARLSQQVHAFEPSQQMATLLRRTSASNVQIHEVACSDRNGSAELFVPDGENGPVFGLASLELHQASGKQAASLRAAQVRTTRLDSLIDRGVTFVKVDVEGHELAALRGAIELIKRSQPIFLVEAEDRHREAATRSVFEFFREWNYCGYFLEGDRARPVEDFDTARMQDPSALMSDGGRREGRTYVNNFFFFPPHINGEIALKNARP